MPSRRLLIVSIIVVIIVVAGTVVSINQRSNSLEPKSDVLWLQELGEAKAVAESESKIVMLYFYSDSDSESTKLETKIFKNEELSIFINEYFVSVKINIDENQEAAEALTFGTPTILFIKPDGELIGNIVGYCAPEDFHHEAVEILLESKE